MKTSSSYKVKKNNDVATENTNTTQNQEYQDLTPIDDGEDIPF